MVSDMMTAEQLKNSILQLALSGKLVPQDKTDEPAQNLLKRIREKKKALIKAKVVPKDRNMDNVSEDEQLFDVPDNWIWTRIGELFQHNTGKALNGSNKEGTVLPYITTSNLYWNRFELDNLKEMPFTDAEIEKCTATKGDLLVCEGGDYGRAAIWNYDFDIRIQNHVHKLRAYEELCTEYFYYLFNFLKSTGQIKGKGIAIQGLSSGALHNLVVPLPPLNEQYRIVEKIHEIIPVWEQYATASTKLNTLNISFPEMMKKSILQEAVQGKLVPQDPNDEPASLLLKKIAEEKKRLIKEGKIKKQKPLPEITEDEIPFDIPESWEWVRFENAVDMLSGFAFKSSDFVPDGECRLLRGINLGVDEVRWDDTVYVNNIPDKLSIYQLKKGDVLLGLDRPWISNGIRVAVFDGLDNTYLVQRVLRIREIGVLSCEYVALILRSSLLSTTVQGQTTGISVPHISPKQVGSIAVPVPSVEEQKRIVEKVKLLCAEVDSLRQ